MGNLANLDKERKFYQLVLDKKIIVHENGTIYNPKTKKFIARTERRNTLASFSVDGQQFGIIKRRAVWIAFNGPITDPTAKIGCIKGTSCELSNLELMNFEDHRTKAGRGISERIKNLREAGIRMVGGFTPKLSDELVANLRKEFKEKPFVLRQRAKEINVSHVTLSAALTGKTFKHIPDPVVNPEYAKSTVPKKARERVVKTKIEKPAKVNITSTPGSSTTIKNAKMENPKANLTIVQPKVVPVDLKATLTVKEPTTKPNLNRVAMLKQAAERLRLKKG